MQEFLWKLFHLNMQDPQLALCSSYSSFKKKMHPGMVAHVCNLSYLRLSQEDWKFKASMDNLVRPCLKKFLKGLGCS